MSYAIPSKVYQLPYLRSPSNIFELFSSLSIFLSFSVIPIPYTIKVTVTREGSGRATYCKIIWDVKEGRKLLIKKL